MITLVLGALGFTGRHIFDHLKTAGKGEIVGVDVIDGDNVNEVCDLKDNGAVLDLLESVKPDRIYNLAGSITNNYSDCYLSNVVIAKNILDAMVTTGSSCRLLLVGSAAEYGLVRPGDLPVKETQRPNPVSMYGLTKVFQSVMMGTYRNLHELDVVMVKPFNLIGKDISENLFPGRLQRSIENLKAGKIEKIRTGSLAARRDYIGIDEAVSDYRTVMDRGVSGETYNIGSGRSVLLRDLLEGILKENGLDMSVVEEMPIQEMNKLDVPDIYADVSRLKSLRESQR